MMVRREQLELWRATGAAPRGGAARRGFTLIEVLVTVVLLAIVIGLLMWPIANSLSYFRSATARADAHSAARIALDAMARELSEAMYVQLDMYDNSVIAFIPPLRVDPDDPKSDIVTPPRPDWNRAVRYWRALNDPTRNYSPATHLEPANPFFVARTVVPYPTTTNDAWNRWNDDWANQMSTDLAGGTENWAPIPRVVHADVYGLRTATLQPGYPFREVEVLYGSEPRRFARAYRDSVVALTPTGEDFDVPQFEFTPTVISGEWLRPVSGDNGSNYASYRAQYPLWRMGTPFSGWSALQGQLDLTAYPWARDPFLMIYRYSAADISYLTWAIAAFDPRTRTMKVLNAYTGDQLYDSGYYPYRELEHWYAFGVDWIQGALRFDFPPLPPAEVTDRAARVAWMQAERPLLVVGPNLAPGLIADPVQDVHHVVIQFNEWAVRNTGDPLAYFLVADTVAVGLDANDDGLPERTLTRVDCVPRDYSDEFQVGEEEALGKGAATLATPPYGWIRLPEHLADGSDAASPNYTYLISYRWRTNGLWAGGEEHPDRVTAYYRSAAVLDINLTVTRSDPTAMADQRISQSARMTRRVKLHNLLRDISYVEQ